MGNHSQDIHTLTESFRDDIGVDVTEFINGKPLACDHLVRKNAQALSGLKTKENMNYYFDLDKVNLIFDWPSSNKRASFKGDHKSLPLKN